MEIIKQMLERRQEIGLTNGMVSSTTKTKEKKTAPVDIHDPKKGRKSLRELRTEIVAKPKAKAVKKYIEESISRLTCESSDDEDV
jgi:hypothetical protein